MDSKRNLLLETQCAPRARDRSPLVACKVNDMQVPAANKALWSLRHKTSHAITLRSRLRVLFFRCPCPTDPKQTARAPHPFKAILRLNLWPSRLSKVMNLNN